MIDQGIQVITVLVLITQSCLISSLIPLALHGAEQVASVNDASSTLPGHFEVLQLQGVVRMGVVVVAVRTQEKPLFPVFCAANIHSDSCYRPIWIFVNDVIHLQYPGEPFPGWPLLESRCNSQTWCGTSLTWQA